MQEGASYIKDTTDFQDKIKHLQVPEDAFLVTAVVGLYPNIPHKAGLKSLKEALDRRREKKTSTEDLVRMAEFVLKNNYFEFERSVYQQVLGTAIGTKFAQSSLLPMPVFLWIGSKMSFWTHKF